MKNDRAFAEFVSAVSLSFAVGTIDTRVAEATFQARFDRKSVEAWQARLLLQSEPPEGEGTFSATRAQLAAAALDPAHDPRGWLRAVLDALKRDLRLAIAAARAPDGDDPDVSSVTRIDVTRMSEQNDHQYGCTPLSSICHALLAVLGFCGHQPPDLVRRGAQLVCCVSVPSHSPAPTGDEGAARLEPPSASRSVDLRLRLFISGKIAARQPDFLDAIGVTHVITCFATGADIDVGCARADAARRLVLPMVDDDVYDATHDFARAIAFTRQAVAQNRPASLSGDGRGASVGATVLVHCAAGMHRSVAVVVALLVALARTSVATAEALVVRARSLASLTPNFRRQLELLAGASGAAPPVKSQ